MTEYRTAVRTKRARMIILLVALCVSVVAIAGCGGSGSTSSTGGTSESTGESTGESNGGSSEAAKFAQEAEAVVAKASSHDFELPLPTTGPTVEPGKKLACIEVEAQNTTVNQWCETIKKISEEYGWTATNYDGQGTPDGERKAILSATATKPDVMILGSTKPEGVTSTLEQAANQGVAIVGMNAGIGPGPIAGTPVEYNVQGSSKNWAELTSALAVANSGGEGEVLQISDETYPIVRAQIKAFEEEFSKCTTCTYLGYKNVPTTTAAKEMPTLMASWVQQYQSPFYVVSHNDGLWFDTIGSGLNGVPPSGRVGLVGKDGSPAAFERIRNGEYEIGTVVSANALQAYMAFDEGNRLIHGEKPAEEVPPYHLITSENIEEELPNGEEFWTPVWSGYEEAYAELWKSGKRKG